MESGDKILSSVAPWLAADWEGMEEAHGWLMRWLTASTYSAGKHKCMGVSSHGGPPETLFNQLQGLVDSWVTDKPGVVGPLEILLSGPLPGSGWVFWASLTWDSFSQITAATRHSEGRIVPGLVGLGPGRNCRERASSLRIGPNVLVGNLAFWQSGCMPGFYDQSTQWRVAASRQCLHSFNVSFISSRLQMS